MYSGIDVIVHNFKPHFIKFAEYQQTHTYRIFKLNNLLD